MIDSFEYGGTGDVVQIAHANAYAPGCYVELAKSLTDRYTVTGEYARPFWPNQKANQLKSWDLFADDLINQMDANGKKSIIGVGHSMGAITSWLAAIKRPDLFKALVLIEPVIIDAVYIKRLKYVPYFIGKHILPIVKTALNRTDTWSSREEVKSYLLSKKVFKRFNPTVLTDFIDYGFKETTDGFTLSFPKEWEGKIYSNAPNMWPIMSHKLCPTLILRAEFSDVINDHGWNKIQANMPNASCLQVDKSGHLLPFEIPQKTGGLVRKFVDKFSL